MKIIKIVVLLHQATDIIFIHSELPEPIWPWKDVAKFSTEAARGTGVEWVKTWFPDVELEILDINQYNLRILPFR